MLPSGGLTKEETMAIQIIQGKTFEEFVTNFTAAVVAGGRFKTCNYDELVKDSFLKLEDYNFFSNVEGIHDLSSDGGYLVLDDAYVLPTNVVLPTDSAEWQATVLTLGSYLMAIQHAAIAGQTILPLAQANKSRFPAFVGVGLAREYYRFPASQDYVTIPSITLVAGDTVEFNFTAHPTAGNRMWVDFNPFVYYQGAGNYRTANGATLEIDGVVTPNATAAHTSGDHTCKITIGSTPVVVNRLGTGYGSYTSWDISAPMWDVRITSAAGNRFYPINDGWATNPVIKDSIGVNDGTATSFIEAGWV